MERNQGNPDRGVADGCGAADGATGGDVGDATDGVITAVAVPVAVGVTAAGVDVNCDREKP